MSAPAELQVLFKVGGLNTAGGAGGPFEFLRTTGVDKTGVDKVDAALQRVWDRTASREDQAFWLSDDEVQKRATAPMEYFGVARSLWHYCNHDRSRGIYYVARKACHIFYLVVIPASLFQAVGVGCVRMGRYLLNKPIVQLNAAQLKTYKEKLVEAGRKEDQSFGPTFNELLPPALFEQLKREIPWLVQADVDAFKDVFCRKYGDRLANGFLSHCPGRCDSLDQEFTKKLNDGKIEAMPILDSRVALRGKNFQELQTEFVRSLALKNEHLRLDKDELKKVSGEDGIQLFPNAMLQQYLGSTAINADLDVCKTETGQVLVHILRQSRWLYAVQDLIPEVNAVKEYSQQYETPELSAAALADEIARSGLAMIACQEVNKYVIAALDSRGWKVIKDLDKDGQQKKSSLFVKDPERAPFQLEKVLDMKPYLAKVKIQDDKGNAISGDTLALLADKLSVPVFRMLDTQRKPTDNYFTYSSGHGSSSKAYEAMAMTTAVAYACSELEVTLSGDNNKVTMSPLNELDANTDKSATYKSFEENANQTGFVRSNLGETTKKTRSSVTAQALKSNGNFEPKAYQPVKAEKDAFTYSPKAQLTLGGFKVDGKVPRAPKEDLPNGRHPADHYLIEADVVVNPAFEIGTNIYRPIVDTSIDEKRAR